MSRFGKKLGMVDCKQKIKDENIELMSGVYEVSRKQSNLRLLGVDESGILYIGSSVRIGDRINHFWGCASGRRQSGHSGGDKYRDLKFDKKEGFDIGSLHVRWRLTDTIKTAENLEARLIRDYRKKYGEVPPLNDAVPKFKVDN